MDARHLPLLAAAVAVGVALACPARAEEGPAAPKIVRQGEAASGYIVVTAEEAEIFAAPADDAASIGSAEKGDAFPLAGKQEGWYFVATGGATHGWIRSSAAATVFYPEYFAAPREPDYSSPPPATPPYPGYLPYPPYPGPWPHRGYGPGWHDRDDWDPAWGALMLGLWMRRHRDRWDDDWDRDRWGRGRGWDRDRDRDRWRDRR